MAFDETKILEIVAEYIKDNPDSGIKNKIDEIFKLNEPMEFFTAANIMNCIRKSLDLPSQPISATNDFYRKFAKDFNDVIKIKIADSFIKTPITFEACLINSLSKTLDNIGFEKYCIIRNHLELNEISIIDINGVIRLAEHKLKNS